MSDGILIVCVFALIVLTAGDPDLLGAIISRLQPAAECVHP